jgi:hypothetical protein
LLADAAKQPGNRDTLRHLLDALADFAGPVECWWKKNEVNPIFGQTEKVEL